MNNLNSGNSITTTTLEQEHGNINQLNNAIVEDLYTQTNNSSVLPTNYLTGDFNIINEINGNPLNADWINSVLGNVNNHTTSTNFFEGLSLSQEQLVDIGLLLTQTTESNPIPGLTIISLVSSFGLMSTNSAIQLAIESLLSVNPIYQEVPQYVESLIVNQMENNNQVVIDQAIVNLNQIDDQFVINNEQISNPGLTRDILNRIFMNRRAIISTGIGLLSLGLNYGSIFGSSVDSFLGNTPSLFSASQSTNPPVNLSRDVGRPPELRDILNSIYDFFIQNFF